MVKTALISMLLGGVIWAQMSGLELQEKNPTAPVKDWYFHTSLGASLNWIASQDYVGLSNNPFVAPVFQFNSQAKFKKDVHEWRTRLGITEGFTYSPPPHAWVKKADSVVLDTIYLYHITPWFGAFGRLNLKTSFFESWDPQDKQVNYVITDIATQAQTQFSSTGIKLTDAFLPLTLEEQAGIFFQPLHEKELNLEFRLGASGSEIFAAGQKVILSTSDTATQLSQLLNVYELGPSAGVLFQGELLLQKLSYSLTFDSLYVLLQEPVIRPSGTWQRLNFSCTGQLSFALLSWLSLNWNAKILKVPAILDRVQLMSNLMLAINFET